MRAITRNAVALACVVSAAVLAATGSDAWGWFLFVAVMAAE